MKKRLAVSVLAAALGACAQAPHESFGPASMAAGRAAPALDAPTLSAYG
ncbi:hypothetical protein [Castellaniella defragrans]|uniref:Uncharacterized protein n=1 Tax=Castellaniella defragrans TaxID=75697 RepID=A0A7W9WMT9_CASDE|nr:hypothetical protein [Castellaniella defragrans]MBB6082729.1 hypothetical protein [Castellaniella defragrans]